MEKIKCSGCFEELSEADISRGNFYFKSAHGMNGASYICVDCSNSPETVNALPVHYGANIKGQTRPYTDVDIANGETPDGLVHF